MNRKERRKTNLFDLSDLGREKQMLWCDRHIELLIASHEENRKDVVLVIPACDNRKDNNAAVLSLDLSDLPREIEVAKTRKLITDFVERNKGENRLLVIFFGFDGSSCYTFHYSKKKQSA